MKIIFVPFDDPRVIGFYRAGVILHEDYPLIFLKRNWSRKLNKNRVGRLVRDNSSLWGPVEHYGPVLFDDARAICVNKGYTTVICFLPHPEFIELMFLDICKTGCVEDFFRQREYYNYASGDNGCLWEVWPEDDEFEAQLHMLAGEELKVLPVAN